MVYGRFRTFIEKAKLTPFMALALLLSSCQGMFQEPTVGKRVGAVDGSFNYSGKGYVYETNPVIASGSKNIRYPNMKNYVSAKVVTNDSYLQSQCSFEDVTSVQNCFKVVNDDTADSTPLQAKKGAWNYPVGSDEFYQINSYYHVNKIMGLFFKGLSEGQEMVDIQSGQIIPPSQSLQMKNTMGFWLASPEIDPSDGSITSIKNDTLTVMSKCYMNPLNASFSPATNKLCLGWNEEMDHVYMAQDPSVIYHEMGHALVKVMMNQRNFSFRSPMVPPYWSPGYHATPFTSSLGALFYDEAGAINEGVADWFSYFVNARKHFGEWGLTRYTDKSRAMTEDDDIHEGRVSKQSGERLSYPQYVYYDPSDPDNNHEDVHYAGQTVSHYLVSLTEELKACSSGEDQHRDASNLVLMLLSETFAELGDMSARGADPFDQFMRGASTLGGFFTNLNDQESYLWAHTVNPPNFRNFFQTFGKNIKHRIVNSGLCPGFSIDKSEWLLDEYGLLLFNNYNDVQEGIAYSDTGSYTNRTLITNKDLYDSMNYGSCSPMTDYYCGVPGSQVNDLNRRNTVLVSKQYLEYPTNREGIPSAFVIDRREGIEDILANLTYEGRGVQISEGSAGVEYNNNNVRISPGEVVGIGINLYNNSNSTMGGAQILANDWDHMKLYDASKTYVYRTENSNASLPTALWSPCQINDWPNTDENGVVDADPLNPIEGDCGHVSRENFSVVDDGTGHSEYRKDSPQPICLVQYSSDNETQWVSQDFYRRIVLNLEDDECLNPTGLSAEKFNPNECLIRFLPGADQATLGKIDPQKSWTQTMAGQSTESVDLQANNIMLMEVNKRIAPGTTFSCRMRARFSNCSDCFEDETGREYSDYEMAGHEPFKLFNFKFSVID